MRILSTKDSASAMSRSRKIPSPISTKMFEEGALYLLASEIATCAACRHTL